MTRRPTIVKGSRENKEADNYVTLAFALLRTDALTEALSRSATTIDPDPDRSERLMWEELRTQSLGNTGRYISFLTLYFASIDTVIRVWTRAKFVNPVVAECLENKRMRQMLTDFRNDLLHGAPLISEGVLMVVNTQDEMAAWAKRLTIACRAHVKAFLSEPSPES